MLLNYISQATGWCIFLTQKMALRKCGNFVTLIVDTTSQYSKYELKLSQQNFQELILMKI